MKGPRCGGGFSFTMFCDALIFYIFIKNVKVCTQLLNYLNKNAIVSI